MGASTAIDTFHNEGHQSKGQSLHMPHLMHEASSKTQRMSLCTQKLATFVRQTVVSSNTQFLSASPRLQQILKVQIQVFLKKLHGCGCSAGERGNGQILYPFRPQHGLAGDVYDDHVTRKSSDQSGGLQSYVANTRLA